MKKCKIVIFKNNEGTVKGVLFNWIKTMYDKEGNKEGNKWGNKVVTEDYSSKIKNKLNKYKEHYERRSFFVRKWPKS